MGLPLKWTPAYSYGGPFASGRPIGVAVHCTESENSPALAEAIAGPGWFGGPKAGTSAHKVVDVDSICEGVKRSIIAYHAGPAGNVYYIAWEFCGRASWSAAKWREPAQLQMLRNAAPLIADDLRFCGAPPRWLSVVQVARLERGLLTHNDIRLAFPRTTTHSDPGPNFPYAELLAYVQEDDMPLSDDDLNRIAERVLDRKVPRQGGVQGDTSLASTISWLDANLSGLAAHINTGDPVATAAALKDALGNDFARQVVAELGKQLATA